MRKNNSNNFKKVLLFSSIIILVMFVSIATYRGAQAIKDPQKNAVIEPTILLPEVRFASIDVEAKSAIVFDINSNEVLFSKSEYAKWPLASITKIMTVFVADDLLDGASTVTISPFAYSTYGEYGLYPGEIWDREDLQDYTLIVSSNDGAVALAEAGGALLTSSLDSETRVNIFIAYMNNLAKEIGLTSTTFYNPSGLDTEDVIPQPQAYGSASDIAKLLTYIMIKNPNVLEASSEKQRMFEAAGKRYTANNTNNIVGTIPGLIASKTGYTDAAGGNLAVVYDSGLNRPVSVVVLGSSRAGRFTDMTRLIKHTQEYFKKDSAPVEGVINSL